MFTLYKNVRTLCLNFYIGGVVLVLEDDGGTWEEHIPMSGLERNVRRGRQAHTRGLPHWVGSLLCRLHLSIDELEMPS